MKGPSHRRPGTHCSPLSRTPSPAPGPPPSTVCSLPPNPPPPPLRPRPRSSPADTPPLGIARRVGERGGAFLPTLPGSWSPPLSLPSWPYDVPPFCLPGSIWRLGTRRVTRSPRYFPKHGKFIEASSEGILSGHRHRLRNAQT